MDELLNINMNRMVKIQHYIILRFSKANGGTYSFKIPRADTNFDFEEIRVLSDFILEHQLFVFANDSPLIKLEQALTRTILEIPIII